MSKLFIERVSRTNVSLASQLPAEERFACYADAYRRAAQTLFRENFQPETRNDFDVIPLCGLYRHAIELYLKAVIRSGNTLMSLNGKSTVNPRDTHSLKALLCDAAKIFQMKGWSWDAQVPGWRNFSDFEKCVADLEKDDGVGIDDTEGDMWRYPTRSSRKGGMGHLPAHFGFDIHEIVKTLELLLGWLESAVEGLEMEIGDIRQVMSDAEGDY